MTVAEIKELRKEIKGYIERADERMLKAVHAMLEADQKPDSDDWLEEVSKEEMAGIKRGLKQLDNGEGIPHNEAVKRLIKGPADLYVDGRQMTDEDQKRVSEFIAKQGTSRKIRSLAISRKTDAHSRRK